MLLWACAGIPLGVYNIVENFNIALRIQPQILTCLSLITWVQCKYYGNKWPRYKCSATVLPISAVMGGIECGLIFALRRAKHDHIEWPITFMAILSACFLCAGVLRHYWDIYQERTVRGISFIFVGIDAMGDLTSLISIFFQPHLDILGMIIYGSELVLWLGVFACGGYCTKRPGLLTICGGTSANCLYVQLTFDHGCSSTREDVKLVVPRLTQAREEIAVHFRSRCSETSRDNLRHQARCSRRHLGRGRDGDQVHMDQ